MDHIGHLKIKCDIKKGTLLTVSSLQSSGENVASVESEGEIS